MIAGDVSICAPVQDAILGKCHGGTTRRFQSAHPYRMRYKVFMAEIHPILVSICAPVQDAIGKSKCGKSMGLFQSAHPYRMRS